MMFSTPDTEEEDGGGGNAAAAKALSLLLLLPLVPAILFGLIFYWIFLRKLKLRRSMSILIALGFILLSYGIITLSDAVGKFFVSFTMEGGFLGNWVQSLWLMIPVSVSLGSLIGLGIILWEIRDIHNNPHKIELPGFWTYRLRWRKTPLELYRKNRAIKSLRFGTLTDEQRAPLGYDETQDKVAYRYIEEAIKHTIVTGAAGSGKSISLLSMMRADIVSGRTVVAVDFKRSPEFAAKLAAWANEFGVPFYHFEKGKPESYRIKHSLGQSTYDPFASGSGSEMVLNMREYDTASAVYKQQMQQLLQVVFAMMEQADRRKAPGVDWDHGGIYQLASAITDANLRDLLTACEGKPIFREAEDYVAKATSGKDMEKHSLEQLRGQMRTIVASAYGHRFKIGEGSRNIDLLKMMTGDQAIILFSFNSEDEPELSRYVGSMIFADLRAVSSQIRNRKADRITNVYVDEFQAVPPTAVNGLLEKARESKIAMTLAQQAFEQIITSAGSNGEAYLQSILVTCSNFLIHAGMTQDSAERVSKLLGKEWKTVYSRTNRTDGGFLKNNFSNRRNQIVSASNQEIWRVEPSEFMALSAPSSANDYKSTAILVNKSAADPTVKSDGTIARKLWMIPPSCVLEEHATPLVGDGTNAATQNFYVDDDSSLSDEDQVHFEGIPSPMDEDDPFGITDPQPMGHRELTSTEEDFMNFGNESYDDGDFSFGEMEVPEETNPMDGVLSAFDELKPSQRPSSPEPVRRDVRYQPSRGIPKSQLVDEDDEEALPEI